MKLLGLLASGGVEGKRAVSAVFISANAVLTQIGGITLAGHPGAGLYDLVIPGVANDGFDIILCTPAGLTDATGTGSVVPIVNGVGTVRVHTSNVAGAAANNDFYLIFFRINPGTDS